MKTNKHTKTQIYTNINRWIKQKNTLKSIINFVHVQQYKTGYWLLYLSLTLKKKKK